MTATIATRLVAANPAAIADAVTCLAGGGLVAFPTETVYGLGADATNGTAVARLYAAKGRPSFNPLIAHVPDLAAARRLAVFDAAAERLAKAFWPGPLTLVLPMRVGCPVADLATAGLDSIAVRVPSHQVARALLSRFGRPIVAPSANRSGHVSPTTARHVLDDLGGRVDLILDGGATPVGVESTIVALLDKRPLLLRPGGLPREDIKRVLEAELEDVPTSGIDPEDLIAPGMMASHYAPKAKLRLNADSVRPGEGVLAFGPNLPPGSEHAVCVLNLSPGGDLVEAAANLFSDLRTLDQSGATAIAVMRVPFEGLGEAINDRLARAAAPRETPAL
jgi:L-threonylcarbamoyladenylate synthase